MFRATNSSILRSTFWLCTAVGTMHRHCCQQQSTNKMQQPFRLLIVLNQPYMFRATNSPILRSNFWLYIQLFYLQPTLLPTAVNQQDATNVSLINRFKSALRVSGDKFAHPQEHYLTVYSFWYNAPTLLPTVVSVHCTKNCRYSQKVLLRMGEFKKINKRKSCCILLVVYIVCLHYVCWYFWVQD